MRRPDLSIIIVNWNARELLRKCLLTITINPVVEVIVVDNGSTDQSVELVKTEFPEVRLIANRTNRGFAAANNQGICAAIGKYYFLLNSDTEIIGDALAQLVSFMDDHPGVGACGPQLLNADGTLQPSGRSFPTQLQTVAALVPLPRLIRRHLVDDLERRDYQLICPVDEVSGAAMCLRRDALAEVGLLDESFFFFGEDVDLCWRLYQAGWSIYYVPQAQVVHLWGGSRSPRSEQMRLLGQRAYMLLMRKHRPGFATFLLICLAIIATIFKALVRLFSGLRRGDKHAVWNSITLHIKEVRWLLDSRI